MTVSALGGADPSSLVKQLLASLQTTLTSAVGALDPADSSGSAQTASTNPAAGAGPPPAAPPPKPDGSASDRFSADTLSSLLQAQERPSASDVAARLIGDADTDGSGTLSLDEITKELSGASSAASSSTTTATAASLKDAFAKLDANGDGQLSQDELAAGLQKLQAHGGGHGHHHHHAYTAAASSTAAASTMTASASTAASATSAADAIAATDVTA